jgi:hypothetical protein
MVSQFEKRNYCAVGLALLVAGLTIGASIVNWYSQSDVLHRSTISSSQFSTNQPTSVTSTVELNYTKVFYDLAGYTIESKLSTGVIDTVFTEYTSRSGDGVKNVFETARAFVIISLVLAFVAAIILSIFFFDSIRNKVIFTFGMGITRIFLLAVPLILVLALAVGFLVFLGLPGAFEDDLGTCVEGPCRTFTDTIKTEGLEDTVDSTTYSLIRTQSWGPDAGWYLVLASIPSALVLLIVVVINNLPLPIDSEASSGEAL